MIDIESLTIPAFLISDVNNEFCFNKKFNALNSVIQEKIKESFLQKTFFFNFQDKNYHLLEISNNCFIVALDPNEQQQSIKEIREATKHSMALQMRILNELGEGIFILDKTEKIIFANPSAQKTLELASYEIMGRSFLEFITPEEEKIRVERMIKKLPSVIGESKPVRFETQVKNKEGLVYLLVYYSIMWTNQAIEGALITIYDISDMRKLTKEIQERSNELLQAEKLTSIGLLASGISHELNNPLSFIISNTSTLEDYIKSILGFFDKVDPSNFAYNLQFNEGNKSNLLSSDIHELGELKKEIFSILQANKRGLTRLSDVISDLRKFSHTNKQDANSTEILDLVEPIKLALNLLSYELKNIDVQFSSEKENYQYLINGNTKLYQIFLNILYNASQAIHEKFRNEPKGVINIKIYESNKKFVLQIADNGPGISEKNLPRIFDPFYTTKPPGIGTGLGLSISQRIINDLGGYIVAESGTILSGATFTLYFPIIDQKT